MSNPPGEASQRQSRVLAALGGDLSFLDGNENSQSQPNHLKRKLQIGLDPASQGQPSTRQKLLVEEAAEDHTSGEDEDEDFGMCAA